VRKRRMTMRLYEVEDGSRGHFMVATQADAKREARERKCTWAAVDVPTDKAGLMEFLNNMLDEVNELKHDIAVEVGAVPATAQDQQDEALAEDFDPDPRERSAMRTVPQHRLAERAAFLGTSEEMAVLTDRIGQLDGWPLGQVALAAAARLKELAS
jgi:hypothetical protein